jgi:hypothetical protein
MQPLLKEVLSLAESNARWLEEAAQHFERVAVQFHDVEKAQWQLLAAVYREKAQDVRSDVEKVRPSLASDRASESRLNNT